MRVRIDYDSCDSNGLCAVAAPEVFHLGEDDLPSVRRQRPEPRLWEVVREAERACPKFAVVVERG